MLHRHEILFVHKFSLPLQLSQSEYFANVVFTPCVLHVPSRPVLFLRRNNTGEEYNFWSTLYIFLQSPVTLSLLGSAHSCVLVLPKDTRFHTHTNQEVKLFLYFIFHVFLLTGRHS
jgi:hypothetical protein